MSTRVSKSPPTPPAKRDSQKFMKLQDFLLASSLSYTTYRRLRQQGKTPAEYKLSAKTILIKVSDAKKWSSNPLHRSPSPA